MWVMMYINYFLMVISFFSLPIWLFIRYSNIIFLDMNHIQFSLIASIFYMLTQTIIMFYFIATGKNIKKFILDNKIDLKSYNSILKMKMKFNYEWKEGPEFVDIDYTLTCAKMKLNGKTVVVACDLKHTEILDLSNISMINMILVGIVFVIGGAIYSSIITDWHFNLLFIFTILHYGYLVVIQHNSFKENTELVIMLYKKVNL